VSQTTEPAQQQLSRRLRFQRRIERFIERHTDDDLERAEAGAASGNQRVAILGIIAAVVGMTAALVIAYTIGGVTLVKHLAYVGVFVSAIIGSASMFVPVPGALAGITIGLTLDPLPYVPLPQEITIALIVAAGSAVGELTGYSTGVGGRGVIGNSRIGRLLVTLMRRHGTLTVFCVAAVPNPFIDVGGIAAGVAGMTMRRFMTVMFIGKTVNYIAVAYAVSSGLEGLQRWFAS
jgi:membrane protein YqaA with SNARE-associated domain